MINSFILDAGSKSPAVRKFAVPSWASLDKGQHRDSFLFLGPAATFGALPCWSTLTTNPHNELSVSLQTCRYAASACMQLVLSNTCSHSRPGDAERREPIGRVWRLLVLHLGVADAAVVAMLADDGGLRLLQLELSRHAVEEERLAPLDHTGHL